MIDGCRLMNSWRGINKPCCYSTHDYASQSSVSVSNSYLRAPQIFMVLEAGLILAAELWKCRLTEGEHVFFMPMCVPLMQSIMHIIHTCNTWVGGRGGNKNHNAARQRWEKTNTKSSSSRSAVLTIQGSLRAFAAATVQYIRTILKNTRYF